MKSGSEFIESVELVIKDLKERGTEEDKILENKLNNSIKDLKKDLEELDKDII